MSTAWSRTIEAQLAAIRLEQRVEVAGGYGDSVINKWARVDRAILGLATPYCWAPDTALAVAEAGRSIPEETVLSRWNLDTPAVWWFFEQPVAVQTLTDSNLGVRALSMGWCREEDRNGEARTLFLVVCWVDDPDFGVTPTTTWAWLEGESYAEMMIRVRREYRAAYMSGGALQGKPQVGEAVTMDAASYFSRFVLSALAWLNQKVLRTSDAEAERHRRKEFKRATNVEAQTVKVVYLRKIDRQPEAGVGDGSRTYSCQWVVDGHWRNQPYGPGRTEHRLIWIHPYVKGPEDKPLRPKSKVYVVSR